MINFAEREIAAEIVHPLSFVFYNGDGTKAFWNPERSSDYAADNETGRRYALELEDYAAGEEWSPVIFKSICHAIVKGGEFGGVEVGFFMTLGIRLFN